MKIIDAFTGKEVGDGAYKSPSGRLWVMLGWNEGVFRASVHIRYADTGEDAVLTGTVRYMHPKYLFQKVVFVEAP